jgi:hypothetical protein
MKYISPKLADALYGLVIVLSILLAIVFSITGYLSYQLSGFLIGTLAGIFFAAISILWVRIFVEIVKAYFDTATNVERISAYILKDAADSEAKRPPIPTESGHPFRLIPATYSDRRRPPLIRILGESVGRKGS